MTEVLGTRLDTARVGRPRRDKDEPRLVDQDLADRLIAQAQADGIKLLGEGGLLKQMTKAILERSMAIELTDHLGYEEGDPAGNGSGVQPQRHDWQAFDDRGSPRRSGGPTGPQWLFRPADRIKGQRRLDGVDKLVMGLYARGMTVRDI